MVEKLPGEKGGKIAFDQVLLVAQVKDDSSEVENVKVGTPTVSGAKVEATIVEQGRAKKITVIKYKRKVRYKRKIGHRQHFTKVKIDRISV